MANPSPSITNAQIFIFKDGSINKPKATRINANPICIRIPRLPIRSTSIPKKDTTHIWVMNGILIRNEAFVSASACSVQVTIPAGQQSPLHMASVRKAEDIVLNPSMIPDTKA
eukprot:CAMPEP_0203758848 /NCGR_PEP_ID=MMETSP0098-20131031/11724_1 /ASSEMBLY_ACC=CAM_ASM_000208 /TAXON_ID=96639 /ORGANISM=" , Strain NY0313808BC1" /LENGTH=112 /DNA_ID=CAMNT_0050651483 /DNA_START=265 /DNA_END=603 /DNA_ORIENTATION=-